MPSDKVIAAASPSFCKDSYLRDVLLLSFPQSVFNPQSHSLKADALKRFIKDVDGLIVGTDPIGADLLRSCTRLKIIAKYGVGLDNIDREACDAYGVNIEWTSGVNSLSVAEQTLGFMLSLSRNLYQSSIALKAGTWRKDGGTQLSGKTIGIIGLGHIGKEVVRLLHPFGCRILVNDIIEQAEFCQRYQLLVVSKDELFRESDIVTIHTPLTPETTHLINLESLHAMKTEALLINTSRGAVVDQHHLKEALNKGLIAGVAIDVYEDEPASDSALLNLPNVFCTPHIAGNSKEAVRAMGMSAIEHLKCFYQVA